MTKNVRVLIGLISTLFLLTVFQNCGTPLQNATDLKSKAASLPFAYDTQMDHLAFMSCSNMSNYDVNAFWTFKASALNNGSGLKLTENYLSQSRSLSTANRIAALGESPINTGAKLQLAIRDRSNLQSVFSASANTFKDGFDYANFQTSFDSPAIAEQLVYDQSQRHNYFNALGINGQLSLRNSFSSSENAMQNAINLLANSALLTLTYNNSTSNPLLAISDGGVSTSKVFGTGYKLRFEPGHGIDVNGNINSFNISKTRTIASIEEIDLETGLAQASTWDCKEEYKFLIVRNNGGGTTDDGIDVACGAYDTPEPIPSPSQVESYNTLRKMLPQSDWYINLQKRCIISKKPGNCYGNSNADINYNGGTCDPNGNDCPHYVSICVRR